MIELPKTVRAWGKPDFSEVCQVELQGVDPCLLPLQAGLTQSSCVVVGEPVRVIVLGAAEIADRLRVRIVVFYSGIVMGSCCADDPTPVDAQNEYCELLFDIDKRTAQATVALWEPDEQGA